MGFKADTSFLKYLTMGAVGTKRVIEELRLLGFMPVELERYCTANKIWATKVKRLRMPDLLCARTGLRIEVRSKSALVLKMSDAPANPDRKWDAGLRDEDIIAFVAVTDEGGALTTGPAQYFTVRAFREAVGTSALGPPKSASEGAERDRTWPSTVPKRSGIVTSVSDARIVLEFGSESGGTRRQTYSLGNKVPYVSAGDSVAGNKAFLAGTPAKTSDLRPFLGTAYDPIQGLRANNVLDRFAAVKALWVRRELRDEAIPLLERMLRSEPDARVALEAAGVAAASGSRPGRAYIRDLVNGEGRTDLQMEAVFILTEIGDEYSLRGLRHVTTAGCFKGSEMRQAAVWGLGKSGLRSYTDLIKFVADEDDNVAMHAICAFGEEADAEAIKGLIALLLGTEWRASAGASEALQRIGSDAVIEALLEPAEGGSAWAVATLGRLPADRVEARLSGSRLYDAVAPLLLLNGSANWLSTDDRRADLAFLAKQSL